MDYIGTWPKGLRQLMKDSAERVVALQNDDSSPASGFFWRKRYVVAADEAVSDHIKIFAVSSANCLPFRHQLGERGAKLRNAIIISVACLRRCAFHCTEIKFVPNRCDRVGALEI
jgi:hypothetical protein